MPLKSNTAILAECFAALSVWQVKCLVWHVREGTKIVCSHAKYVDGEGGG